MAKSRINLVKMMNEAWDARQRYDADVLGDLVVKKIAPAFNDYESMFIQFCKEEGNQYKDEVFIVYQHIFLFFMLCDDDFLQGEYDAYCKFCKWANIKPLSTDRMRELYREIKVDTLINDIGLLFRLRNSIPAAKYEDMVQGFCYLTLLGDRAFDENEYYILRCFYEVGYDIQPSDWEAFKKEWK